VSDFKIGLEFEICRCRFSSFTVGNKVNLLGAHLKLTLHNLHCSDVNRSDHGMPVIESDLAHLVVACLHHPMNLQNSRGPTREPERFPVLYTIMIQAYIHYTRGWAALR
jgi:hypothetical protein